MEYEHHHVIDRAAFFAGIVSGVALVPQVWVTLASGTVDGVSLITFIVISLNSVVWLMYAMHRGLIALGIASLLNALAASVMVVAYLWFTLS